MELSTVHWEGTGSPTLLFAHATGFHKSVWQPTVDALRTRGVDVPAVGFDFRSHGASPKLDVHHWDEFADDVEAVTATIGEPVVGIGHSMGGASLLGASLRSPLLFRRLILVEPIVFPSIETTVDHPLTVAASKRRRTFPNKQAALDNFASKAVFARWTEQALSEYVEGGLVPDGDEWALACEPEHEADTFRHSTSAGLFERLAEVSVPVTLVIGATTSTYPTGLIELIDERLKESETVVIPDTGHFAPMEKPGDVAAIIASRL